MAHAASFTITPTTFSAGDVITISGGTFTNTPPADITLCFTQNACLSSQSAKDSIVSWSSNSITIQPPQGIPLSGQLLIFGTNLDVSVPYHMSDITPTITNIDHHEVIPEDTILTLQGAHLGQYNSKNRVCIDNQCISQNYLENYISTWKDNSISLRLPYAQGITDFSLRIDVYLYTELNTNTDIYQTITLSGMSYVIGSDPIVSTLSPSTVIPDKTVISITGENLGNGYDPNYQRICFDQMCLSKDSMSKRIISWNDNLIQFTLPGELALYSDLNLSVYLYYPTDNTYKKIGVGPTLHIVPTPIINEYTPNSNTGGNIILRGKNFGDIKGNVEISGQALEIVSWTSTEIEAYIPSTASSGLLTITNTSGATSLSVYIDITPSKVYSKDPFSSEQWYIPKLHIEDDISKPSPNNQVVVAVIDSGVDFTNPELKDTQWINTKEIPNNNIDDDNNGYVDDVMGWDFTNNKPFAVPSITHDHGTEVASIIGAQANDLTGFAGIYDNAKIMSLRVTEQNAPGEDPLINFDAAKKAIHYAVDNGAKVINLSFSGETPFPIYKDILNYAYAHNVLVIAAAGNNSSNLDEAPQSPICDDESSQLIIGVGSLNRSDAKSDFSNYGSCVDVYLPGEDILAASSFLSNQEYMYVSGTSFAAPLLSGIAARLWALHPDWNVEEIKTAILQHVVMTNGIPVIGSDILLSTKPQVIYEGLTNDITVNHDASNFVAPLDTPSQSPLKDSNNAPAFTDIGTDSPLFSAVQYLQNKGVIEGYSDGTFKPNNAINRAEFLKIVLTARGIDINTGQFQNCFPDVTTQWFAPYVCYAKALGYIEGYNDSGYISFKPEQTINRAEAIKVLMEVFQKTGGDIMNTYYDVPPGAWFAPYISEAKTLGIIDSGNFIFPGDNTLRGTMADMTFRMMYISEKSLSSYSTK